jgi:hypothetical protein
MDDVQRIQLIENRVLAAPSEKSGWGTPLSAKMLSRTAETSAPALLGRAPVDDSTLFKFHTETISTSAWFRAV